MRSPLALFALSAMFAACSSPEAPKDPPLPLDDIPGGWAMVAAGDGQTCGIAKTSFVYCWGKNDRGQLGDGTEVPHSIPARVLSDSAFSVVTAGTMSSCGITRSGVGYCWGLVDGDHHPTPVNMDPQRRFTMLRAGVWMICGLTTDGAVYCWSLTLTGAPAAQLSGGVRFKALVNSQNFFCAISIDGKVYCWEADSYGIPTAPELRAASPVAVKLAAGDHGYYTPVSSHQCTIRHDGGTYCWGDNREGQLGLGDREPRNAPTLLASHEFADIGASGGRTCGVAVNGVAYCWGWRVEPQIEASDTARAQLPGVRAATVSLGDDHFCFLTAGGAAFCAGANGGGQLGTGTSGEVNQPLRKVLDPA